MGYWVNQTEDALMPDWLKGALSAYCTYCGKPMMNYYNDSNRCTNRKCSDPNCIGFLAAKADFARSLLNMGGVGFKSCLRDIRASQSKTPFELLAFWGCKPVVDLALFLRMHCFEGIDNEWVDIVQSLGVYTLDELYEKYNGKWRVLLDEHKDEIYYNSQFVTFKGRPSYVIQGGPKLIITIMITGTPIGYASKEAFVSALNAACRGIIVVRHQATKRQSGVDFLIREPGSTTRGKVEAAIKGGIPIVTSEQFTVWLANRYKSLVIES